MEYFLIEMQYSIYVAKEEMIESLQDMSKLYNDPRCTLEQQQTLNEMSLGTVGVYITKVTASIAKAWADFQAGFQDSTWATFKKLNTDYLSSTFKMKSSEGGITIPKLEEIREFLSVKLPQWDEVSNKPLEDEAAFFKLNNAFSALYDNNDKERKSVQQKADEIYFIEHKGAITYEGKDLVNYTKFMNEYGNLKNRIADDIKQNKVEGEKIKAEAEKAQSDAKKAEEKAKREEEKAKQDAEKAKAEADKEKVEAERKAEQEKAQAEREANATKTESYNFDLAGYLLESILLEDNKFTAAEGQPDIVSDDSDTASSSSPLSDEEFKNKLNKITIFYSGCTSILSAKMKTLNKARSLSFDLIKQYCNLAKGKAKEEKKKDKESKKQNTNEEPTENKEET